MNLKSLLNILGLAIVVNLAIFNFQNIPISAQIESSEIGPTQIESSETDPTQTESSETDPTQTESSETDPTQTESSESDEVTFLCGQIFDPASEEYIPATLAWIPQRQTHIQIIGWKSEYFGINNKKRCDIVTEKFAKAYQQGSLNYLTTGRNNNLPIICAIATENDLCNGDSQLFTLKPHNNPNLVLEKLIDILEGDQSTILYQSSGSNRAVLSISELFKKGKPLTECRKGSADKVGSLGTFAIEKKNCPAD